MKRVRVLNSAGVIGWQGEFSDESVMQEWIDRHSKGTWAKAGLFTIIIEDITQELADQESKRLAREQLVEAAKALHSKGSSLTAAEVKLLVVHLAKHVLG